MIPRILRPIAALVVTTACIGTPNGNGMSLLIGVEANNNSSQSTKSIFDIPTKKTPQEIKSMVQDELPKLRESLRGGSGGASGPEDFEPLKRGQIPIPRSKEEKAAHRKAKGERMAERRERARDLIRTHQPEPGMIHRMEEDDVERVYDRVIKDDPDLKDENNQWLRDLGNYRYSGQVPDFMAPIDQYYGKYCQTHTDMIYRTSSSFN